MNRDDEHLKLLAIFHYVVGGITALFSLMPIIHLIVGIAMIVAPASLDAEGDPAALIVGWIFAIIGGGFIAVGLTFAACIVVAGRNLARRRRYLFCLIIAGLECMCMPFGTVLGVFTIIVLTRDTVKDRFTANHELEPFMRR